MNDKNKFMLTSLGIKVKNSTGKVTQHFTEFIARRSEDDKAYETKTKL